ncbi:MAG: endolytic transglycosylase MltG [Bacteroidota bacterium]
MMHKFLAPYRNNPGRSLWGDLMPFILAGAMLLILAASLLRLYISTTRPVIDLHGRHKCYFYVHTGSGFNAVRDSLVKSGYLVHPREFEWLARRKHYPDKIRPGRYLLEDGMHNNALLNMLRSGKQESLRITIQGVRNSGELAGSLGRRLEVDSAHLMHLFSDPAMLTRFGATPATLLMLFVPNTYEFFWNTSGDQLLTRMESEFKRFWTSGRRHKADSLQMTIAQVVTMASIVEKESNKNDEKPVIAGVYINRLKHNIPLQADPTVVYAWHDFTIRRVLKVHTQLNSPYNTYMHTGLPPGPICLPSVASVDAVLHATSHSYLYFCAKEDFSGSHNFASTLDEHNRNARRYQKALDKMKIK